MLVLLSSKLTKMFQGHGNESLLPSRVSSGKGQPRLRPSPGPHLCGGFPNLSQATPASIEEFVLAIPGTVSGLQVPAPADGLQGGMAALKKAGLLNLD